MYKNSLFDYINILFLFLFSLLMIYPFIYILNLSLSSGMGKLANPLMLVPAGFNIEAYKMVFINDDILIAYYNSIKYAAIGTIVYIILTSVVAYPLTVKGFWPNKGVSIYYVLTMFVSGGLIPTYLLYRFYGLINSMWVMVLPGALNVFSIMVFRTYFQGLGTELRESAYIDGANDIYILFRIFMPLSKPIIATFALYHIVGIWNNFFTPFIYLNREKMQPLTVLLRRLLIELDITTFKTERTYSEILLEVEREPIPIQAFRAASIIVSIFPIMCIYPFIQKFFVKGIMIGALKA